MIMMQLPQRGYRIASYLIVHEENSQLIGLIHIFDTVVNYRIKDFENLSTTRPVSPNAI